MTSISALNRPLQLPCGAVLPNRLAKAALSEQLATSDLSPSDALVRLYRRWSSSGAGLIITGNVMIDRSAITEARNEVLDREEDLPRYGLRDAVLGGDMVRGRAPAPRQTRKRTAAVEGRCP